jgi:ATP-dependent exoDNAse (exonuclease V) alpha subunit
MERAKEENAQLVLMGDIKQYQSISTGTIFYDLQRLGAIKTVTMSEVKCQEKHCLIDAVAIINREGNYTKAFDLIDQYQMVNEIENDDERINAVINAYLTSNRDETILIASTNKERYLLNFNIRRHLLKKNIINNERECSVLSNIYIHDIDKSFAQNYQTGHMVIVNQQGILGKNGESGIIVSTDIKKHSITAKKIDGTCREIDLTKYGLMISTYQPFERQFGAGERIMFGRNDKKLGVKNGQIGIIKKIDGNCLIIEKQGKKITLDLKSYPFVDYAYAITDIKAQGKTARNVIVVASAKRVSKEFFYVQLTRAKTNLQFFVDDAQKFRISIEIEKSKNSTLHKLIQRIHYERGSRNMRDITIIKPDYTITRQPAEQNQLNFIKMFSPILEGDSSHPHSLVQQYR